MLELTVDARISNLRIKGSQDIYYQRRYPPSVKLSVMGRLGIFSNPVLKVGSWQRAIGNLIFCLLPFANCRLIENPPLPQTYSPSTWYVN